MNTPINDFLNKYNDSGVLRCHMPGHKGHTPDEADWLPYAIDITEISGADSLFEADGIIRQSEEMPQNSGEAPIPFSQPAVQPSAYRLC